ncbi:MAG: hypothetical protein GDA54_02885 [Alphaproteobacteria bacterium GM7ARS4]|nr:hypothetical protein [Alphaproteobacteria bacterium GM7ARS4]
MVKWPGCDHKEYTYLALPTHKDTRYFISQKKTAQTESEHLTINQQTIKPDYGP